MSNERDAILLANDIHEELRKVRAERDALQEHVTKAEELAARWETQANKEIEHGVKVVDAYRTRTEKAEAFKKFVHDRLDKMCVPKEFPNGVHTKAGCRIGDRLDWVERNLDLRHV